jgi:hypothetical protein
MAAHSLTRPLARIRRVAVCRQAMIAKNHRIAHGVRNVGNPRLRILLLIGGEDHDDSCSKPAAVHLRYEVALP